MMYNVEWATRRDAMSESFRLHGNRTQASSGKRLRAGGESIGQRSWQYPYILAYGPTWWEAVSGSYRSFLEMWQNLLCTYNKTKLFYYFVQNWKGCPAHYAPREETFDHERTPTEKENQKQAMRLAQIAERQTVWDIVSPGIGIELKGDSLLVSQWLTGRWRCDNKQYMRRIACCIDSMEQACNVWDARSSGFGKDLYRHEFREDNTRADLLTHLAREGQCFYNKDDYHYGFEDYLKPVALRGCYDGGVCSKGTGCGFWLQIGYANHRYDCNSYHPYSVSPFPPSSRLYVSSSTPLVWREVAEAAWVLEEGSTITDAELSAAEALSSAARDLLRQLHASS